MTVDRIAGIVSLEARAQAMADLQGRPWYVVRPVGSVPFATAAPTSISPLSIVVKILPAPS